LKLKNDDKRKQKWWHQPHAILIETKKSINHKSNIKIKFRSHIGFLTIKTSKQDITWLYFDKLFNSYFLITVIYILLSLEQNEWSARTNENNCQKSLYVIPNNKYGVKANQNKGQTHVVIIRDITRYYYSQNKILL
jgi:hypothetical protein